MTAVAWRPWVWRSLVVVALMRFGLVWVHGLDINRGDFYATMPGAHVQALNPDLWNSPDLSGSWAFQRPVFLYGPAQHLTVYPIVAFVKSYAQLARVLLWAYTLVIALTVFLLWRAGRLIEPDVAHFGPALVVAAGFFMPLQLAFLQREFEIVVLCATAAALVAVLQRREPIAAALVGYITWFKFFPLVWVPYFALRRWWGALGSFAAMSLVVLAASLVLFGTRGFGGVSEVVATQLTRHTDYAGICAEWTNPERRFHARHNTTWVDAQWALCSIADRWPGLPVLPSYLGLLAAAGGLFLIGFARLQRRQPAGHRDECWRRGLEVSLLIMASATLFHAHYYYLSLLLVPLSVLLVRYMTAGPGRWWRRALWMTAYLLLAAFAMPISISSMLTGTDFWRTYMLHTMYFPGVLVLLALLLAEYLSIPRSPRNGVAAHAMPSA